MYLIITYQTNVCIVYVEQSDRLTGYVLEQIYAKFQELTFWEVDILGVDISGVDILGVDILGVDILGRTLAIDSIPVAQRLLVSLR